MAEELRVVAHLSNGTVLKGTVIDFSTTQESFQMVSIGRGSPVEIRFVDLKAAFFVKDLRGKPQRRKLRGFLSAPGSTPQGIKIAVVFKDGEILCGYSYTYSTTASGFFMFPADATGNNLRVYVNRASTTEVAVGPAADMLLRGRLRRRAG